MCNFFMCYSIAHINFQPFIVFAHVLHHAFALFQMYFWALSQLSMAASDGSPRLDFLLSTGQLLTRSFGLFFVLFASNYFLIARLSISLIQSIGSTLSFILRLYILCQINFTSLMFFAHVSHIRFASLQVQYRFISLFN